MYNGYGECSAWRGRVNKMAYRDEGKRPVPTWFWLLFIGLLLAWGAYIIYIVTLPVPEDSLAALPYRLLYGLGNALAGRPSPW